MNRSFFGFFLVQLYLPCVKHCFAPRSIFSKSRQRPWEEGCPQVLRSIVGKAFVMVMHPKSTIIISQLLGDPVPCWAIWPWAGRWALGAGRWLVCWWGWGLPQLVGVGGTTHPTS